MNKIILAITITFLTAIFPLCKPSHAAEIIPQIPTAGRATSAVEQNIEKTGAIFNQQKDETNINIESKIAEDNQGQSGLKIRVTNFKFSGDILFPVTQLRKQLESYLDKDLSVGDLKEAADKIAAYYRTQGYIVTNTYLPPQDLSGGNVDINISVAKYGHIEIENKAKLPAALIRRELGNVREGEYITQEPLDRALLFLNDLAGINAKANLKPGDAAGYSDFVLLIDKKEKNFSSMLSVDNYGNNSTGKNEFTLGLNWYNLAERGDFLNVNWLTTDGQMNSGNIMYTTPFGGAQGSTINLSYSHVFYTLGVQFLYLNYLGMSDTTAVTYNLPLERSRLGNQTLSFTYNNIALNDNIRTFGLSSQKNINEGNISYSGNYYDKIGGGAYNSYNLTASFGNLTVGGANANIDSATTKTAGDYSLLNGKWIREQALTDRWQLRLSLSGQFASKNLNGSEEFVLSGPYAVRAWAQGEYSGDEGWLGSAEFKYNFPKAEKQSGQYTAAIFYDAGGVSVNKFVWSGYNAPNDVNLQGYGLGLIWQDPESQWYVRGDVAWKLSGPPSNDGSNEIYWLKLVKMM